MIEELNQKLVALPILRLRTIIFGFPAALESEFFTITVGGSMGLVRFTMVWAFLLMAGFGFINMGILQAETASPLLTFFTVVRIAIICPYILFCIITTFIKKLHRFVHPLVCLSAVFTTVGISGRIAFSTQADPAYSFYYAGLILVCIAVYTGVRMRFIYAAPIGAFILFFYMLAALAFNHLLDSSPGVSVFTNNVFFLLSAEVMMGVGCFFSEYYRRHAFLLQKKIHLEEEINKLKAIESWKDAYRMYRAIDAEVLRQNLKNTLALGKKGGSAEGDFIQRLKTEQAYTGVLNLIRSLGTGIANDQLFERVMDMALEMAGARRGCIILRDERSGDLQFVIRRKLDKPAARLALAVAYNALTEGKTVALNDTAERSSFPQRQAALDNGVRSLLCFPIMCEGEAIGACYLDSDANGSQFSKENSDMLDFFITQAVLSLKDAVRLGQFRGITIDEEHFSAASGQYDFTDREKEILLHVLKGYSNNAISEKSCISMNTLRTHLKNIYGKAGVAAREELIDIFAKYAIG
jgi:DNA-binding CsgD family transcriptional regulator